MTAKQVIEAGMAADGAVWDFTAARVFNHPDGTSPEVILEELIGMLGEWDTKPEVVAFFASIGVTA